MKIYSLHRGDSPLLVSVPHAGTHVSAAIAAAMTEAARPLPDTDWHVDRLYDWVPAAGAGLLVATHSRYVIDLNRPPDDAALYEGHATGLVPGETFAGEPIWLPGYEPGADDRQQRLERYWRPYHRALEAELAALAECHGHAVLLDGHSIRARVPALFPGRLPDLNLGTFDGRSADPALAERAWSILDAAPGLSAVRDGRFKGGYITRACGAPPAGIHALQLEIAQACYMDEAELAHYDPAGAEPLRAGVLQPLIERLQAWRP